MHGYITLLSSTVLNRGPRIRSDRQSNSSQLEPSSSPRKPAETRLAKAAAYLVEGTRFVRWFGSVAKSCCRFAASSFGSAHCATDASCAKCRGNAATAGAVAPAP